ncbi:MAG: DUF2029 domain-containing protein [Bacteroidetes bacterium]|nr:DUF2029 domain-containing protein [Bacteroidota bacterium]MBL6942902.1 DUF2029 domain-containing protein [Bacteroidales bacterium]
MINKIKPLLSNYKIIALIFLLLAVAASIQSLLSENKIYQESGLVYNRYNNYTIFEKAFHHLIDGKDLYAHYPEEHFDLYKYSPSFAAFFGIFAIFPDWIGLNLWNLFNTFILLISIYYLPKVSLYQKGLILIFLLIELITSIQNAQSNALIAGLIILAFGLLEKDKYLLATFLIIFSVFIKLFGIVGLVLFIYYPKKWRVVIYSALWSILFLAMPLIFIGFDHYDFLLSSYWKMLSNDHSISYGYSVMGMMNTWFDIEINKLFIVIIGVLIFLIPLLRFREYSNYTFRFLTLSSILIWVVIFNHKAESPTFIIAIAGASLWFVTCKKSRINIILFVSALVLTSLSPTDIFPIYLREKVIIPYTLKVVPCILIWLKIIYDMIVMQTDKIEIEFGTIS